MAYVLLSAGACWSRHDLSSRLRAPSEAIASHALYLHRLTGVEMLSSNYTPLYLLPPDVAAGQPHAQAAQDTDGCIGASETFCATKLGLLRETKSIDGSWEKMTVLEPVCILRSEIGSV
jgi:hypothetical protein